MKMLNLPRMITSGVLCSLVATTAVAAELVAGKYPKVYKGSEGLEVTVVPLEDTEPKRYLVQVKGVESRIDDVVQMYTERQNGKTTMLYTYVNDKAFHTIHFRDSTYSSGRDVSMFLPEAPTKSVNLWYDEKASKQVDSVSLVKRHQKQREDGTIEKVEIAREKEWKGFVNGVFKRVVDDAEAPCGGGIGAKIDWDSVDKSLHGKIALASRCVQPVEVLERMCSADQGAKYAKKISGITCVVSNGQSLSLDSGKRLVWKVPAKGAVDLEKMETQLSSLLKK